MRFVGGLVLCLCSTCVFAAPDGAMVRAAKSLLSVQNFPKTFDDLSFSNRMAVLAEGYEPWEGEYDASGRCISGCAYKNMTIEEELAYAEQKTQQAISELNQAGGVPSGGVTGQPVQPDVPVADDSWRPTQHYIATGQVKINQESVPTTQVIMPQCSPRQPEIRSGQWVPLGEPVTGRPRISSPFGERIHPVTGNRSVHRGIDLAVPAGTNVFSPASGHVARVWTDSTCGNGLRIAHGDGFETVYCHLSDTIVKSGDVVNAGCLVAKSGNTGRSTGAHLHYAIKKNGDYINPSQFLGR